MIHLQKAIEELTERRDKIDRAIEMLEKFVAEEKPAPERPTKPDPPKIKEEVKAKRPQHTVSRRRLHRCMYKMGCPATIKDIRTQLQVGFNTRVTEKTITALFLNNPEMFHETDTGGLWVAVRRVE